ncbi:M24 family metallopeptidase [Nanoarchaeota archaeon]
MKLLELQKQLRKEKIDYLFLTNKDPNFTYFTQKSIVFSFSLLAIPQKGKPLLFVNSLDKEKTSSLTRNILIKKPFDEFVKKHLKPKEVAYNASCLTVTVLKQFKKIFPKTKFQDFSEFLLNLRAEKTKQEIIYLKKACKLTVKAFHEILKRLKKRKFKTENDIVCFLQKFALKNNADISFPSIASFGKNTGNPHHFPGNQKLKKGFLMLDFGITCCSYRADMTRMIYLGKPSAKELKIYNFLLDVQKQTIKNIRLGQTAGEVDQSARKLLGKYSSYFLHGLGHGVGVEIHELPSFKPDSEDVIKENQIFTVEPGIYLKNFGLRIEDTVLMKKKPIILTKVSKELIVIK